MSFSEKRGSLASTTTKNPSSAALQKRSQLKSGWCQRGSRFIASIPNTAPNAENSTVNSKMTGKNAGIVVMFTGLPCTMSG